MTAAIHLGRYQLGHFVPLPVQSDSTNDVPSWPDATPTIKVYDCSDVTTVVETIRPGGLDVQRVTGLFRYMLRLGSSYAANKTYVAVAKWAISATTYGDIFQWDVLPGGDADGSAIGCVYVQRPEADVVAFTRDGGKLQVGRNPR